MFPIYYSDAFLEHLTGLGHPERPGRLTAIKSALEASAIAGQLEWRSPTDITTASPLPWVQRVHIPAYIQTVQQLAENGGGYLDGDTPVSPRSYDVALLAVNAWIDAVKAVTQSHQPAFVLARPPGHHACPEQGMGFCLFSNAAIAAVYAIEGLGLQRVTILDWDVHHGNGTQAIVEKYPQISYCSLHQAPCYPGTGSSLETGVHHNILNVPVLPGSTIQDYQQAFEQKVQPFLANSHPDLLIVSAGYDANAADPLADINLNPQDFGVLTRYCLELTPNIVLGLEGGYDFKTLAQSVLETLLACVEIKSK